ncbi:MAG: hypothetical protein H6704_26620 [Myxococcales bacterium]|nr:hypothetical protein [Myxococcales bacterium]
MRPISRPVLAAALSAVAVGCTTEFPAPAAEAPDAAPVDAAPLDGGAEPDSGLDAGPRLDATARLDAGPPRDAAPIVDAVPVPDLQLPDAVPPDAACAALGDEVCNGLDDDCDGRADEGRVCAAHLATFCSVHLGWARAGATPDDGSLRWGTCPSTTIPEPALDEDIGCTITTGDGRFRTIDMQGTVDGDDAWGLALTCEGSEDGLIDAWVQRHCRVYLGHANGDFDIPPSQNTWGACPANPGDDGTFRCVATGGDGAWHPLRLPPDNRLNNSDTLAIAFRCEDPDDPGRSAAVQQSVEVWLGWAQGRGELAQPGVEVFDGSERFGACPETFRVAHGNVRCVASGGDGRFHTIPLTDVEAGRRQVIGIALRPFAAP